MAAYCRVYDSRHLQADCKEPGSAVEPFAQQSSMGHLYLFFTVIRAGAWVGLSVVSVCVSHPGKYNNIDSSISAGPCIVIIINVFV